MRMANKVSEIETLIGRARKSLEKRIKIKSIEYIKETDEIEFSLFKDDGNTTRMRVPSDALRNHFGRTLNELFNYAKIDILILDL